MTIAVLTAITNSYDTLKPFPVQSEDVETICVTDSSTLTGSGWQQIVYEPHPELHPNRAAKRAKCCPWEYTDAEYVIWLDASMSVTSPSFARDIITFADPIAQFKHPWRDCIYEEAEASLLLEKYSGEPIREQIARYHEAGHPRHWGLWSGGVIVRRHTHEVEAFGKAWLAEIDDYSFQDQISQPPMLSEHGLRPTTIPGGYFQGQNLWLRYDGSKSH